MFNLALNVIDCKEELHLAGTKRAKHRQEQKLKLIVKVPGHFAKRGSSTTSSPRVDGGQFPACPYPILVHVHHRESKVLRNIKKNVEALEHFIRIW
ncbi:hypothetical protein CEXT_288231 [Caerostris extrusa]|uniref:Uncharacterized protein n=1 Tax=Caerostris extrusa TaxID=172846 RepID=A0AAV4MN74_CAEEX|nr:hypothetical protein CEXT_288231 [Caerostris extrusa]